MYGTTTANQGALNVELNLIQDYLDISTVRNAAPIPFKAL